MDPMVDAVAPGCQNDPWMFWGAYFLDTAFLGNQRYFVLTWYSARLNLADGVDAIDLKFRLCLSSGVWFACPGTSDATSEWTYFREIYGYGLFMKDLAFSWWYQIIGCTRWDRAWEDPYTHIQSCWSSSPKEYVFCSRVVYGSLPTQEVSLCGSISNFASDNL
jgi:hypothetical protein